MSRGAKAIRGNPVARIEAGYQRVTRGAKAVSPRWGGGPASLGHGMVGNGHAAGYVRGPRGRLDLRTTSSTTKKTVPTAIAAAMTGVERASVDMVGRLAAFVA